MLLLARWFTLPAKHQSEVFFQKKISFAGVFFGDLPPTVSQTLLPALCISASQHQGSGRTRRRLESEVCVRSCHVSRSASSRVRREFLLMVEEVDISSRVSMFGFFLCYFKCPSSACALTKRYCFLFSVFFELSHYCSLQV